MMISTFPPQCAGSRGWPGASLHLPQGGKRKENCPIMSASMSQESGQSNLQRRSVICPTSPLRSTKYDSNVCCSSSRFVCHYIQQGRRRQSIWNRVQGARTLLIIDNTRVASPNNLMFVT
ncbi:unnamed protein product [Periconia digitata]|uniref:Uncharacterized protein n=1 Tax=Periconia digitata TaxID=1303443 RepID=A0A9W4US10_9PLEO|nr:unnamed protein product [Periconia digitata]